MAQERLITIAKEMPIDQRRRLVFLVYIFVTGFAQEQETALVKVVVISSKLVVYIEVAHTFVLYATKLASHISSCAQVPTEHSPHGSAPELGTFFGIRNLFTHDYLSVRHYNIIRFQFFFENGFCS